MPFYAPGRIQEAELHGREVLNEATSLLSDAYPDLEVSTHLANGTPTAVLRAEADNAECLVLGAKGENIGNALLGSTALQLVGHVDCPVVLVGHPAAGHHRIVVGTDGSPAAAAALAYAFQEAARQQSVLHVVSALGLPQGWPTHLLRPLPEDNEEVDARRRELESQLAPLREQHPDVQVELDVHRFAPVHSLAEASNRADLLVVGSRGRGGFHGLAVGSVTHKLMHFAGCPMVVVPNGQ